MHMRFRLGLIHNNIIAKHWTLSIPLCKPYIWNLKLKYVLSNGLKFTLKQHSLISRACFSHYQKECLTHLLRMTWFRVCLFFKLQKVKRLQIAIHFIKSCTIVKTIRSTWLNCKFSHVLHLTTGPKEYQDANTLKECQNKTDVSFKWTWNTYK